MKQKLLFAILAVLFSASIQAQETSVTNPTADTWVRTDNTSDKYGSNNTFEIKTFKNDTIDQCFYSLLSFSFTKPNDGYKVKKATLRLTTRYKKGDSKVNLYDFPHAVSESDTWNTQGDNITAVLKNTADTSFKLNGDGTNDPTDKVSSDYTTVDKWQNTIDVTELVNKHASEGTVAILLQKDYNQNNSSQIYSRQATDITNKKLTPNFTFKKEDLLPQLTVEYEKETDVTIDTKTSAKDTWIFSNNKDNHSASTTMEIYYTTTNSKYLYGLMSFALPGSNYEITSAKLRLTTERIKSDASVNIYAYKDFEENTIYSNEEDSVKAALARNAVATFTANTGSKNNSIVYDYSKMDSAAAVISKWQTTVDLTSYANSLGTESMNLLLSKTKDEDQQLLFFTKEQGDLSITTNDNISQTISKSELIPQLTLVYKKASYDLSVTSAGAATLVLPYEATIPSGVTAYTLTYASGDKVTATAVSDTIPANTPVLINASEGTYTFEATDKKTTKSANPKSGALTGVYATTTVPQGSYILYKGTSGVGFYKVDGSTNTVGANRAYLTANGSKGAKALSIIYEGETTGIETINGNHNSQTSNLNSQSVYNLAGQRVSGSYKGVVIKNGRKYIQK